MELSSLYGVFSSQVLCGLKMVFLTSEHQAPIYRVLRHPLNFKFHQPSWLLPMINWMFMELKQRFGSYLAVGNVQNWIKPKLENAVSRSGRGLKNTSRGPRYDFCLFLPLGPQPEKHGQRIKSFFQQPIFQIFQNVSNSFPLDFVTSIHIMGVKITSLTAISLMAFEKFKSKCVISNLHIIG